MSHEDHREPFFIFGGSLEDLAKLFAIIRGDEALDEMKLHDLLVKLRRSTNSLTAAEQNVPPPPHP